MSVDARRHGMTLGLGLGLGLALWLGCCEPARAQEDSAIEWKVGGGLRVRGFYQDSRTRLDPPPLNVGDAAGPKATASYLDTRLRLSIRATAYQEVSAVLAIEVGDIRFGDEGGGTAGRLGADGVVFENKNLYLEWHPTRTSFLVRVGLYPRESDPYGLVLSDDVAGVHAEVELLGLSTVLYGDAIKAVENSRNDLDGDGEIDNDYNDRTIFIVGVKSTFIDDLGLELFGVADVDDSADSPDPADTEIETYWLGATGRTHFGPVQLTSTWIGAYGNKVIGGAKNQIIKGLALDQRISFNLPFVTVQGIFAWASGRDPDHVTTDQAFPVIAPFYGVSEIVYQAMGGFNVTGSNLSGTTHATIKLQATPVEDLTVEVVFLYAWFTSDRDVSGNTQRFNEDARDIGFEADLNLTYQIAQGFKVFARSAIFFPGKGYVVQQDTRHRGPLSQIIVGAQLGF